MVFGKNVMASYLETSQSERALVDSSFLNFPVPNLGYRDDSNQPSHRSEIKNKTRVPTKDSSWKFHCLLWNHVSSIPVPSLLNLRRQLECEIYFV